ncbi:MAG TPA: glycoside hydrolase family 2 TIM barrel-domain containing protein [Polyangia bacterium]|nr:glycoside hydrolase family 2 TIM barrel-domain containing protein [Polyangia bacterium]
MAPSGGTGGATAGAGGHVSSTGGGLGGGAAGAAGHPGGGGAAGGSGGAGLAPAGTRQTVNVNQSWKFLLGDYNGAEKPTYDDSAWNDVGLPHSFSLPYFLWTSWYQGYGWYRRHVTLPASWAGKRVFIEFQGAFQDAQVYVNGTQVGQHQGGYTGFSYDITSKLTAGDNVIAVRLSNAWNARIAPRAGDHEFTGGIYRNVLLVVTDPLHVTWYGTFVTTPTLAANAGASSTVNVKTEVRNDRATSVTCTVRADILDAAGTKVATVSSMQVVPAGMTVTFDQTTPAIASPALWHPDHPNMYKVVTTVSDGSADADTFTTPFGFRWFSWSATAGFSLNGSHYYIRGADVHQDHAGWADAVSDSALFRDVKMVKDAGFNFIRGSHYPKAPSFAEACDQLGVLLWSENCFWGAAATGEGSFSTAGAYPANAADQAPFETNVLNTLTDMIRIHRNHPSIVVWSMSNEPFFTAGSTIGGMRGLLTKEVNLTHQLDPTRPAGIGGAQRPTDNTRIDLLGDIAGYNGDGATLAPFQNPGVANMVSEYGSSNATTRPGNYDPGWGDLNGQLTNGVPTEFAWRSGQTRWCMFDYGTHFGPSLATTGIVDNFRIPKRAWYWYRNAYAKVAPPAWPAAGTPAGLQLTASTTTLTAVDGTQDAQLMVTVVDGGGKPISNNVPVTLAVTSGPGELPTGPSITFTPPSSNDPQSDIAIQDGQAAIEFRSYYAGTSVITATSPGLKSATVTITSQGSPAYVPGVTLAPPLRAYSRYAGNGGPGTTSLTLALNHPTSASSTGTGTTALANDGDTATSWTAAAGDANPWWQLLLEVSRTVNTLEVTFPAPGNYRYTISVSPDGKTWTTAVDQSQTTSTAQTQRATGSFGSNVLYVRVNFVGVPPGQQAGLAEVVVGGM